MHDLELFMIENAMQVRQKLNNVSDPVSAYQYEARTLLSHPKVGKKCKA
jgi:hypothetical protein